jgi:mannosyltransferase OCH1-like enzyme
MDSLDVKKPPNNYIKELFDSLSIPSFFYEENDLTEHDLPSKAKIPKVIIQIWKTFPKKEDKRILNLEGIITNEILLKKTDQEKDKSGKNDSYAKDASVPEKYKQYVNSVRTYNPTYKWLFFKDDEIDEFLQTHYPQYYQTFLLLPENIQKMDFFRYIAVYHYGGFYFDLDILCFKPLDDFLLQYESIFPVDNYNQYNNCGSSRCQFFKDKNQPFILGQYGFAAKPKNEFIKLLVDTIHINIDEYIRYYNKNIVTNKSVALEYYVYATTGPEFVSYIYSIYKKKDFITILEYQNKIQYFGSYALHDHVGSWKKNITL